MEATGFWQWIQLGSALGGGGKHCCPADFRLSNGAANKIS